MPTKKKIKLFFKIFLLYCFSFLFNNILAFSVFCEGGFASVKSILARSIESLDFSTRIENSLKKSSRNTF